MQAGGLHLQAGMKSQHALWMGAALASLGAVATRALVRRRRRFDLKNRVVLITGGSRGLGLELARRFASEGARVALLARSEGDLRSAAAEIAGLAPDLPPPLALSCDVTDSTSVANAVAIVMREHGRIDVLVNNAGTIQVGPARHMRRGDFERAIATHFWGPLYAMDAVVPILRAQGGGRIVNVSSIGGKLAVPHLVPYSASKHALVGLSDGLRSELARDGIHVTTVCPGLMRTGSHLNVEVRGQHEAEFARFAVADSLPGLSMDASRAAGKIVNACRHGDRQLTIGLPARLAILASALAPESFAALMAAIDRVALPGPAPDRAMRSRSGWQSRPSWLPSFLTRASDRAVLRNNELAGHSPEELARKLH
jgi:NAD(P)-dependent dehydrogenase (short-subunit alcohol dehydrogenase family)